MSFVNRNSPDSGLWEMVASYGTIRSTHYEIQWNIPQTVIDKMQEMYGISVNKSMLLQKLNWYCSDISIPQSSVASKEGMVGVTKIDVPHYRIYDDINATFYIDGGHKDDGAITWRAFQAWLNVILDTESNTLGYYNDYICDIVVKFYTNPIGQKREYLGEVTFHDCWPSNVQSLTLTGKSSDALSFACNLKCRNFTTHTNNKYV